LGCAGVTASDKCVPLPFDGCILQIIIGSLLVKDREQVMELFAGHPVGSYSLGLYILAKVIHPADVAEVQAAIEKRLIPRQGVRIGEIYCIDILAAAAYEPCCNRISILVAEKPAVIEGS
jgi:hypothetical protein